ncbi:hypothetical protein [Amycolatopsis saalfeldensis]|uniref:Uncharacterized protein n=1 Tax=Amycolatopsis saalfeldensis TaxID=394193 RepID=A0A1H8XEK0_9PSEU|nr:hypothetical protein [Amycolatopsis saalfeldensis]SEP38242.1 hypothetical protein SAMN04489732_107131 [Amycolatopsis saalfeldensis]
MEPLTAVAMIATKYGVSALIGALSGNQDLSGLASELVGTLVASEDRLGERLGTIGRQLEEVLEQRYSTAIAAGQRTLLDAAATPDPLVRSAELTRARDLFRDAAASARTPLQVAVAERYVVLCAIALGREDAARTALGLLDKSALEALLGALPLAGPEALDLARTQLARSGRAGSRFRREERADELAATIVDTAAGAVQLALSLFKESRALAEALGYRPAPEPDVDLVWFEQARQYARPIRTAQVLVQPVSPGLLRFGPLSVIWDDGPPPITPAAPIAPIAPLPPLPPMEDPNDPAELARRIEANNARILELSARIQETQAGIDRIQETQAGIERLMREFFQPFPTPGVTVRAEPALSLPLRLALPAEHIVLDAGAREARLGPAAHGASTPGQFAEYALRVNETLVFKTCLAGTTPR